MILFRAMVERHHAAMFAADEAHAMAVRREARALAVRVNHGDPAICRYNDAPAYALERATAASDGNIPLWGQKGNFVIEVSGMRVRIAIDGMFGIGMSMGYWPGFGAYAIDYDRPFLSQTGYRSFLGVQAEPIPGMTPETFAREVITRYVKQELKKKGLLLIEPQYRKESCEEVG